MTPPPLTPETRQRILVNSANLIETSSELLELLVANRRRLQSTGVTSEDVILNAHEMIILLTFDLACLLNDLATHNPTSRAQLYARFLVLTIRQAAHVLPGLLKPPYRTQMVDRLGPQVDAPLKEAHSRLTTLFRDVEAGFGDVRDGIVAHFDKDADRRAALLAKVNVELVAVLAVDFLAALSILTEQALAYSRKFWEDYKSSSTP